MKGINLFPIDLDPAGKGVLIPGFPSTVPFSTGALSSGLSISSSPLPSELDWCCKPLCAATLKLQWKKYWLISLFATGGLRISCTKLILK